MAEGGIERIVELLDTFTSWVDVDGGITIRIHDNVDLREKYRVEHRVCAALSDIPLPFSGLRFLLSEVALKVGRSAFLS